MLFRSERVAVLYIDLDNFKQVNDTFGHDAGDRLIIEAVRRIREAAGSHSGMLRLGGDEFAVFLRDDHAGLSARAAAKRAIADVSRPIDVGVGVGFVSASVGIAFVARDDADYVDALHRADLAMYQAKQEGKNRYAIYSTELEVETEIGRAHV